MNKRNEIINMICMFVFGITDLSCIRFTFTTICSCSSPVILLVCLWELKEMYQSEFEGNSDWWLVRIRSWRQTCTWSIVHVNRNRVVIARLNWERCQPVDHNFNRYACTLILYAINKCDINAFTPPAIDEIVSLQCRQRRALFILKFLMLPLKMCWVTDASSSSSSTPCYEPVRLSE